jgi:hypothetical protein
LQDSEREKKPEELEDTKRAVLGTDFTDISEGFLRYLERHREEEKRIMSFPIYLRRVKF